MTEQVTHPLHCTQLSCPESQSTEGPQEGRMEDLCARRQPQGPQRSEADPVNP